MCPWDLRVYPDVLEGVFDQTLDVLSPVRQRVLAILAASSAIGLGNAAAASAATLPVACTPAALITAIESANASAGPDTLQLSPGCTYSFTEPYSSPSTDLDDWYGPSALPAIASDITIEGNGAVIQRGSGAAGEFRLFFVGADPADPDTFDFVTPGAGKLTLRELTLRNGVAQGGDSGTGGAGAGLGGAIFSQGDTSLIRSTIAESRAEGGLVTGLPTYGGAGMGVPTAFGHGGENGGTGFGFGFDGGGSSGGSGGLGTGGGGGGGFRRTEDGSSATGLVGADGGGPATGLGGVGGSAAFGVPGGTGGNGSGGGGTTTNPGDTGSGGGDFGAGGIGGATGGGGGGGVGGGGGSGSTGGAGGFGGGGGVGFAGVGGAGGFGGGGGATGTFGSAEGGFGGGTGVSSGGGGAGMGGAIFNHQGELSIENSTLSANRAVGGAQGVPADPGSGFGGAVFNLNGALALDSATFASNVAENGGAIYSLGYIAEDTGDPVGHSYSATVTVTNSILADSLFGFDDLFVNSPATVSGGLANTAASSVTASGPNVIESRQTAGGGTFTGTAPITTDPGLAALAANGGPTQTHAITTSSSAFNTGETAFATDQRGITRPQSVFDDIGAFEVEVASPTLVTNSSPSITLGGEAHDTATLSGGTAPTGQITFGLYGPDDPTCTAPAVFADTKPVVGNGAYVSASFTPTQAGTYRWIARYAGDYGNNAVSGACNDPNQSFTVTDPAAQRSLDVSTVGSGSGFVDSTPAGIDCGRNIAGHADCAQEYANGTSVTLSAHPSADTVFAGFTGDCAGTGLSCTTTMDRARSAVAAFTLKPNDPTPLDPIDPADILAPKLTLDYEPVHELGRTVAFTASCDEPCAVVAKAKLKTVVERNGDRIRDSYTVRKDGFKLGAGETVRLELTLTEKAKNKARHALDSGGSAKVKGVVTATDESFNVTKQRFEIELD